MKSSVKYKQRPKFQHNQHLLIEKDKDSQVGAQSSPEMENLSLMFLKLISSKWIKALWVFQHHPTNPYWKVSQTSVSKALVSIRAKFSKAKCLSELKLPCYSTSKTWICSDL